MFRRRSLMCVGAVYAAAGLGACGGSSTTPSNATQQPVASNPAPATTSTTTATIDKAADNRAAKAALLTLDDFPSGWTTSDESSPSVKSPCKGIQEARKAVSGRATAPTFSHEGSQASHVVYVYPDEATAGSQFASLTSGQTRRCFGKTIGDAIRKDNQGDTKIQDATTGELGVDPVGTDSAAARVTIPFTESGIDGEVNADIIFVRQDRALSILITVEPNGTFDEDLRARLTGLAARHARDALAR